MASVTSASDKANGIPGKPVSKEAQPATEPDVVAVEEEDEDEEDEFEELDDEEERQIVGDEEEDDDNDQEEEGEQDGQDKPQSLTHFLLNDQPEDNDEDEEEEAEDVYIPPAPEPMSRKRSHQEVTEVTEGDEEPDSKKAKA